MFEFASLHDIRALGNVGTGFAVHNARIPATMIEMEVRIDYDIDFFGRYAVRLELVRQARRPFDRINVRAFGVPLIAGAGFRAKSTFPPRGSTANSWPSGCDCGVGGATRSHKGLGITPNIAPHRGETCRP